MTRVTSLPYQLTLEIELRGEITTIHLRRVILEPLSGEVVGGVAVQTETV
jgi:hypothetical protein